MPQKIQFDQYSEVETVSPSWAEAWRHRYAKCGAAYFGTAYSRSIHFLNYTEWQVREEFCLPRVTARDPDERGIQIFSSQVIAKIAGLSSSTVTTMLTQGAAGGVCEKHGRPRTYMTAGRVSLVLAGVSIASRFSIRYPNILARPCALHFEWWKAHVAEVREKSRVVGAAYRYFSGTSWKERLCAAGGSGALEKIKRSGRRTSERLEFNEYLRRYRELDEERMQELRESGVID